MAIYKVALRKESVDRNNRMLDKTILQVTSLSARRAWIEMPGKTHQRGLFQSLSARRAWIEINVRSQPSKPRRVALRKESVDRNLILVY